MHSRFKIYGVVFLIFFICWTNDFMFASADNGGVLFGDEPGVKQFPVESFIVPATIEIRDKFESYLTGHPADKVYLHLDKDLYLAGEYIWFKSYVLDGFSHFLLPGERNVYVEMIDTRGDLVRKKILKSTDGIAWGDFALSDDVPDGNYLIRAYTNRIRNLGEEYFYQQQIYISNPDQKHSIRFSDIFANRLFNRRLERKARNYQLSFYPEGGPMIRGVPVRLSYRVSDKLGRSIPFTGEILNASGQVIQVLEETAHGRGVIEFTPEHQQGYSGRVYINGSRRAQRISLPELLSEGVGMRVDQTEDSLYIRFHLAGFIGDKRWEGLSLLGISQKEVVFTQQISFSEHILETSLPVDIFPPGIVQFYLVDQNSQSLSHRLVFIEDRDPLFVRVENLSHEKENIEVQLVVSDDGGRPLAGQFSVSVTADKADSDLIFSEYLLLASEFAADIGPPADLLDDQDQPDLAGIDLLLQGRQWERYQINDVLTGMRGDHVFDESDGIYLSGEVYNPSNDELVAGHKITLHIKSGIDERYDVVTNDLGVFEFSGMQFYDLRDVEVVADRMPNGDFPRVLFFGGQDQSIAFPVNYLTQPQEITGRSFPWRAARKGRKSPYQAPRFHERPAASSYGTPSQTIYITDNDRVYRNLTDVLLNRATGITVYRGQLVIRGPGSIHLSNEPMFMVDEAPVLPGTFFSLNIADIHKMAIYKGPRTSIFGIYGANGVIIAYTRRGDMYGRRGYELQMAGFSSPREFSAAEHTITGSEDKRHRPTVYWQPDIKTGHEGQIRLSFSPLSGVGNYQVNVMGIDESGRIVSVRIPLLAR